MCGRSLQAITTGKLTPRSDIYSLGILLWELLTKDVSYKSLERHGVLPLDAISHAVKNLILPKVPVGTPPGVEKLIQSCWNPVRGMGTLLRRDCSLVHCDLARRLLIAIKSQAHCLLGFALLTEGTCAMADRWKLTDQPRRRSYRSCGSLATRWVKPSCSL